MGKCCVINIQKQNSNTVCVAITEGHCVKSGCETSLMPSDFLWRAVGAHSRVSCLPGICTWDVNESLLSQPGYTCIIKGCISSSFALTLRVRSQKHWRGNTLCSQLCFQIMIQILVEKEKNEKLISDYINWSMNEICILGPFIKITK